MPFLIRARSAVIGTAVAALAAVAAPRLAAQRSVTAEPDIKAAFLFNFTKFVEWPASPASGAFRICTIAEPAFDSILTRTLSGESTDGRPIVRATPDSPDLARACHILFIARPASAQADRWVTALRGAPVLIVGESKSAEDAGAHITFVVEDNRVKFDVNDDAAARAGLRISSKLLRVARHVTPRSAP